MDKLPRKEPRDVWDDLMERIDLSGNYETFINPTAIANLVRLKEEVDSLWFPICSFLQDHPEIIGAKLGESLSKKLLEYLKGQHSKGSRQ